MNLNASSGKTYLTPGILDMLQKVLGGVNSKADGDSSTTSSDLLDNLSTNMHEFVRSGDYRLARHILKDIHKHSHYGFNELHYNALRDYKAGDKVPDFKPISVTKKATCN